MKIRQFFYVAVTLLKNLLIVFFLFFYINSTAQNDSLLIHQLVQNIAAQQVSDNGEFYKGMFPSFRKCGGSPHNFQPDNNIFFTGISIFSLKNILAQIDKNDSQIVEKIIANTQTAFPFFRNKDGFPFYNFWATNSVILPHTYYFKYLKGVFGQGEDADDAVISLMAINAGDSACKVLKKRMIDVSNLKKEKIISTYSKYNNFPAYSTYLGYRMKPDFDFGVQCNILYFILEKKLPLVKQDSATINLLALMIKNRDYVKTPTFISPYYVKTSVLIYHIARLMEKFKIDKFEPYRKQLITDANETLKKSTNIMDEIILRTALIRLGSNSIPLRISSIHDFETSNQNQFIFFQARAAFSYPTFLKKIFLHWSYISYYFYCPTYNKILWLEYLSALQTSLKGGLRKR